MFVCLITPSELGDIAPKVRCSEVPKSEISYVEPPPSRITNEQIEKNHENQGAKCRKGSETLTNRSGIQFLIDIVPQNFSYLQRSSEIQDFQFWGEFRNILAMALIKGKRRRRREKFREYWNIFEKKMKILYLRAPLELSKVLQHYIDQEFDC